MISEVKIYFLLKALSNFLALLWGFLQTFIFIRVFDYHDVSVIMLTNSICVFLMYFDFGLSKIYYVAIREKFIAGQALGDNSEIVSLATLFGLVLACGALLIGGYLWLFDTRLHISPIVVSGYFLIIGLNLPWQLLQNASSAVDNFIPFEMLEVARRGLQLLVLLALLAYPAPLPIFLLLLAIWGAAIAAALRRLQRAGVVSRYRVHPLAWYRALSPGARTSARQSATFLVGEAVLHQTPLLLTPLFYGLGAPVIIADTVFKVFRGAATLCRVSSETLVPQQTAAFFRGDRAELQRRTAQVLGMSLLIVLALEVAFLFFGNWIFSILLNVRGLISGFALTSVALLIVAGMLQNTFGSLLQNTGSFRALSLVTTAAAFPIFLAECVSGLWSPTVGVFLLVYALCYFVAAAASGTVAWQRLLRAPARAATEKPLP